MPSSPDINYSELGKPAAFDVVAAAANQLPSTNQESRAPGTTPVAEADIATLPPAEAPAPAAPQVLAPQTVEGTVDPALVVDHEEPGEVHNPVLDKAIHDVENGVAAAPAAETDASQESKLSPEDFQKLLAAQEKIEEGQDLIAQGQSEMREVLDKAAHVDDQLSPEVPSIDEGAGLRQVETSQGVPAADAAPVAPQPDLVGRNGALGEQTAEPAPAPVAPETVNDAQTAAA